MKNKDFFNKFIKEKEVDKRKKEMSIIRWGCQKNLSVDHKLAACQLAQNQEQIFGVPEGTLYADEISFGKTCSIHPPEVTKVW